MLDVPGRESVFSRGADDPVDKALRLDTNVMLVDDPVKRVDNHSMAWGLEARVPFLDHELVELAGRIPAEHKLAHGGKGVLKEAARLVVPSEVIDRPKGYFPVPALKYIEGDYLDMVDAYVDHYGLQIDDDTLRRDALEWATTRGGRSGRVAWQFIQDLAGRLETRLC